MVGDFQGFGERGKEELLFHGYRVLILQNEKSPGDGWGDGCPATWMHLIPPHCTLKSD